MDKEIQKVKEVELEPLGTRVLVRPIEDVPARPTLVVVSPQEKEVQEGYVIAVGNSVTDVITGDRVMFTGLTRTMVKLSDTAYLIVPLLDVLAVVYEDE